MEYDFCVVTQPRSGDEMLISKLRSHPNIYITLGKPYEEFCNQDEYTDFEEYLYEYKFQQQNYELKLNEQDITHSLNTREYMEQYYSEQQKIGCIPKSQEEQIHNFLDHIYCKDKEKRKKGYIAAAQSAIERYTNFGITTYGNSISTNNYPSTVLSKHTKYIILFRKNLLWQYVSTMLPVTVNEHGYTKITDVKLELEKVKFEQFIIHTLAEREKIKQFVQSTGQQFIEIYYEDLAKQNRKTLDMVQQFLKVPIQENELYGITPDNIYEETRPLETIVTNYSTLKNQLSDESIQRYFKMAEESINPFYYEIRKAGTFKSLEFLREMNIGKP
jgi:hypothetical protein